MAILEEKKPDGEVRAREELVRLKAELARLQKGLQEEYGEGLQGRIKKSHENALARLEVLKRDGSAEVQGMAEALGQHLKDFDRLRREYWPHWVREVVDL